MVVSDRTKGCCSSDLNEPPHPNHDQFAELDAHNCCSSPVAPSFRRLTQIALYRLRLFAANEQLQRIAAEISSRSTTTHFAAPHGPRVPGQGRTYLIL
jgi:hypothetical protein